MKLKNTKQKKLPNNNTSLSFKSKSKIMKKIFIISDILLQTLVVLLNIYCIIVSHKVWDEILIPQFLGGMIQMISSAIHIFITPFDSPYFQPRKIHFFGSLCLIMSMIMLLSIANVNTVLLGAVCIVIPQIILYLYYLLCLAQLFFPMKKRPSTFY